MMAAPSRNVRPSPTARLCSSPTTAPKPKTRCREVNGALTCLNLESNLIGAEGGRAIAKALRVNRTLRSLDVQYNLLSEAESQALRDAARQKACIRVDHVPR